MPPLHHDGGDNHRDHHEEGGEDDHQKPFQPGGHQCPTCPLVDYGFPLGSENPQVPDPIFIDASPHWADLLERLTALMFPRALPAILPPDPPERSRFSRASRLVTRSAISVRGPDLV